MLLLDTCALIWLVKDPHVFSKAARDAINKNADDLHISAISSLEIALLASKNRIVLPEEPFKWYSDAIRLHGVKEVPVTGEIASMSGKLPAIHKDPCDRIIIATAVLARMDILTADKTFGQYKGVTVIW